MHSFLSRLRRRKLVQWALAYLGGGWLVLQLADVMVEPWQIAPALLRILQMLLAVGFFVVLVLAWYHGERGQQRVSGPELLLLAMVGVVGATLVQLTQGGDEAPDPSEAHASSPSSGLPLVAVLPFDDISAETASAYFAEGMQDEVIAQLSGLSGLRVVSRTSTMMYPPGSARIGEIARELGADYILEGSARNDGGRVRLTLQLIDGDSDEHVWTERYDRDLTAAGLFEIQADVARQVADALRVQLADAEQARLGTVLTSSATAYDLYLRALQLRTGRSRVDLATASELLEEALRLDPKFAAARAELAITYFSRAYNHGESSALADSGVALARRVVREAPELAAGHAALGLNLLELGRLEQAAQAYSRSLELQPSHDLAYNLLGFVRLLQGDLVEAARGFAEAHRLDPRGAVTCLNLAMVYMALGDRDSVLRWFQAAVSRAPDHPYVRDASLLGWGGKSPEWRLGAAERYLSTSGGSLLAYHAAARAALDAREYNRAVEYFSHVERMAADSWDYWGLTHRTGFAYALIHVGRADEARHVLLGARSAALRLIQEGDERAGIRRELAAIHEGLGDTEEALDWFERAVDDGWRLERMHPSLLLATIAHHDRHRQLMTRLEEDLNRMRGRIDWGAVR